MNPIASVRGGAFVTSYDPSGALRYSTSVGGGAGYAIAVDSAGQAYVTGATFSSEFPTKDPIQSSLRGGNDAFVTKLSASGTSLVWSTYLGGSAADDHERGNGIGVDGAQNAYVTGNTYSDDFPTVNALQPARRGGRETFVAKLAVGSAAGGTTVQPRAGEPGSIITAGATGATPNVGYVLRLGTTASNCASGIQIGGPRNSDASGNIPATQGTIPTNVTSGTRYACFARLVDSADRTAATQVTVL